MKDIGSQSVIEREPLMKKDILNNRRRKLIFAIGFQQNIAKGRQRARGWKTVEMTAMRIHQASSEGMRNEIILD